MSTLQSQLDQVLALVDQFALTGGANWTHPKREVFANELRSRLSEIRAAVGGGAVNVDAEARRLFELNSAGWAVKARWDELHPQTRELWHAHALKSLNPPATVGVGALRNLIDEMQTLADRNTALGMPVFSSAYIISRLAALIGEKA